MGQKSLESYTVITLQAICADKKIAPVDRISNVITDSQAIGYHAVNRFSEHSNLKSILENLMNK